MRYLIIALLLVGCGPGPKSARGDDLKAVPKETYTQTLTRVDRSLETIQTNTEATNATLETIDSRTKSIEDKLDSLQKLLTADTELSVPVPPVRVDAPPVEAGGRKVTLDEPPTEIAKPQLWNDLTMTPVVMFHGKPINLDEWMSMPLAENQIVEVEINKRPGSRADVEKHVRWHGVSGDLSKFNREQLVQIHSVAHLKEGREPVKSRTVVRAVIPQATYGSGCPNGQCQRPTTYYYRRKSR